MSDFTVHVGPSRLRPSVHVQPESQSRYSVGVFIGATRSRAAVAVEENSRLRAQVAIMPTTRSRAQADVEDTRSRALVGVGPTRPGMLVDPITRPRAQADVDSTTRIMRGQDEPLGMSGGVVTHVSFD